MSDEKKLDIENELGLMGCLLQDSTRCLPLVRNRGGCPAWFRHAGIKALWISVTSLTDAGKPIDPLTALDEWRRLYCKQDVKGKEKGQEEMPEADVALIERCIDTAVTIAHVEYYADSVRERFVANMARSAAREFSADVGHGTQSAIQAMAGRLNDLLRDSTLGGGKFEIGQLMDQMMTGLNDAYQVVMVEGKGKGHYSPGLELPWAHMNNLYGSLIPGLHFVGGRPGQGKTTIVNNWIRYWCDHLGLAGGVNSMDMTPKIFFMRNAADIAGVSLKKAMRGMLRKDQMDRYHAAREQIRKWKVEPDVIYDLDRFRSWVTLGVIKKGWKFVVIDYVQQMHFKNAFRMSENDRLQVISGSLKELGNTLGIPVIAVSQLSRDCDKDQRRPRQSDLRGGGSLEQDAKTILMMWKDQKVADAWKLYGPKALAAYCDDQKANEYMAKRLFPIFALLVKNQDGETGEIPMVMYPNYYRFRQADYLAESDIKKDERTGRTLEKNDAPKFGRVHRDWRNFPEDDKFERAGGIVTNYADGDE